MLSRYARMRNVQCGILWSMYISWSAVIAAVGIALGAAAYAQPAAQQSRSEPNVSEQQPEPPLDAQPTQQPTIQDLLDRVATALESDDGEADAQWQREQDARDLKAQESMAKWAKFMFWATCGGVMVTLAGVILVYFTLKHTADAAEYARQAVVEGKRAADAAEASIEEARATTAEARRQADATVYAMLRGERPYLFPRIMDTKFLTNISPNEPFITCCFDNHGRMPATIQSIVANLLPASTLPPRLPMTKTIHTYEVIKPGASTEPRRIHVEDSRRGEFWSGKDAERLLLIGSIQIGRAHV